MAFAMNLERTKIIILTHFSFQTLSSQLLPTPIHLFTTPTHIYYLTFPKPFKLHLSLFQTPLTHSYINPISY